MPLTDAKVRALKGLSKPFKVKDAEGLFILVTPQGSKLWRQAYRFAGRQKSLALGQYPMVSLLEARRGRDAAKRLLFEGIDPAATRRQESTHCASPAIWLFQLFSAERAGCLGSNPKR